MCASVARTGASCGRSICRRLPSQPLRTTGREGVALAREDLQHLRELGLEDEQSFVGGSGGVVGVERVADLGDQPLAAGQPGEQRLPVKSRLAAVLRRVFDVVLAGALAALPGGANEDRRTRWGDGGRLRTRRCTWRPAATPKATRNWISSAIGSASVCGSISRTNSPAGP